MTVSIQQKRMDITKLNNPVVEEKIGISQSDDMELDQDTNDVQDNSSEPVARVRSTKEYRMLYYYLLTKFRSSNDEFKSLDSDETKLNKMIKYHQLRNNMLIDLLQYIDTNEELASLGSLKKNEIIDKMKIIKESPTKLDGIFEPLIEIEKLEVENGENNLKNFITNFKIKDEFNYDLNLFENTTMPDIYSNENFSDLFETIKKNKNYHHDITSYLDVKKKMDAIRSEMELAGEMEHYRKRKRAMTTGMINAAGLNAKNTNGNVDVSEKNGNLRITLHKKQKTASVKSDDESVADPLEDTTPSVGDTE